MRSLPLIYHAWFGSSCTAEGEDARRFGPLTLSDRWLDWRGWIALVWVLWWGWCYGLMAFQARAPQVREWLSTIWR